MDTLRRDDQTEQTDQWQDLAHINELCRALAAILKRVATEAAIVPVPGSPDRSQGDQNAPEHR